MKNKLLSLSLSALMILAGNVSADCDEIGYFDCGTTGDVKWYLSSDKATLTFSGTGQTANNYVEEVNPYYDGVTNTATRRTSAPWGQYNNTVTHIEVESGVTSVSWIALGFEHVTDVKLPDTLQTIGEGAFNRTYSLTQLDLPNSLKTIGEGSFFGTGITDLIIPNSVTNIERVAFRSSQLQTIFVPDSVTSIGNNALANTSAVIYCTSSSPCEGKGSQNIVSYEKEGGVYILDGKFYTSLENMQKDISREAEDTNDYTCGTDKNKCKRDVLEAKGICQGSECDTFIQSDGNYMLKYNGKTYQSINDLLKGNYDKRRIYTVEEANFVAGERNTVTIRYK